jgi:hypothetical protein
VGWNRVAATTGGALVIVPNVYQGLGDVQSTLRLRAVLIQSPAMNRNGILLLITLLILTCAGCGRKLPTGAKQAVLDTIGPASRVGIYTFERAKLLPKDIDAGIEEAWCVNMTFRCRDPEFADLGDFVTCADSRLVRLIDGQWSVSVVITERDREDWKARGCELPPEFIGG